MRTLFLVGYSAEPMVIGKYSFIACLFSVYECFACMFVFMCQEVEARKPGREGRPELHLVLRGHTAVGSA